ncbi:MAG: dTDP-4-dehydrorhamnose reductase [Planctomycetes bacterium]|nr:dTDP-4-dehydrorhamnose reductase [Planctomycetota bacterium]
MAETNKSIVILGAAGMLGTDLVTELTAQGIAPAVFDLPAFDITDSDQVANAISGCDLVINCAAYTNVEKAESEPELAYKVNADAVGRLGNIASAQGVKVLHISTDFVFDGTLDRPYVETDDTNALSIYGKSKLEGEKLLLAANPDSCIIRIQWTYGNNGNNFIKKLVSLAQRGKPLRVVDDQVGSPTATEQVSAAIRQLINNMPTGIFHLAAAGFVSRFDMAKFIFDKLAIKADLTSCKTSDFSSAAQRPLNSRLDCSKISSLLDGPIESWQNSLEKYLKQFRE